MDDVIDRSADYRIEEVAALKGVPYVTVRSAIVMGELAAVRHGRDWVVRGADVVAWTPQHWKPIDHDSNR